MIWNNTRRFKYAFIGAIVSTVLVQSVSITNALAEVPSNDYLSINGEKSQIQMQNLDQNHFQLIPTTFNQQE
jgi:hypothetical protein